MESGSKKREIGAAIVVLVVIATIGGVLLTREPDANQSAQNTTSNRPAPAPSPVGGSSEGEQADEYRDGTYIATGRYGSPGGNESITLRVTLREGRIATTSATTDPSTPEGAEYQRQFIEGYQQQVVGKEIDSIRLSRVSGSSLTSQGFNDALEQIKTQASSQS